LELGRETAALPDIDSRSPDELCGYDENGMWALMVVDTSVIAAVLFDEPEAEHFANLYRGGDGTRDLGRDPGRTHVRR
jgi:hypothetical protein